MLPCTREITCVANVHVGHRTGRLVLHSAQPSVAVEWWVFIARCAVVKISARLFMLSNTSPQDRLDERVESHIFRQQNVSSYF